MGGAFGCKGPFWPHTLIAAVVARDLGRPVKLALTRHNMFSGTGHRPATVQTLELAADKTGRLQALRHQTETGTSPVGEFLEQCGTVSRVSYASQNIEIGHLVYPLNLGQSSFMRAPGEAPGTWALESAMDELAVALRMDPLALRQLNDPQRHPISDKPWSTKHLRECQSVASEKFGWSKRNPEPRSMRDGRLLVGWGMAHATYPANKRAATAKIRLGADLQATVWCATHDLGTGMWTIGRQISADAIGLPLEQVKFEIGSSDYPLGPVAGGSNSSATVSHAIAAASRELHRKLAGMAAADPKSPLYRANVDDILMTPPGRLVLQNEASRGEGFADILQRAGMTAVEVEGSVGALEGDKDHEFHSFGVHFCEVKIDPELPKVRVTRWVSAMDIGRPLNAKTARSQVLGGVVMGVGMALLEETVYDRVTGLPATRNLADYHVPVNADIEGEIDVIFEGEPDYLFTPTGGRGVGEIGITGVAAAIANAVYHATGKRIRDLPITPDKLM